MEDIQVNLCSFGQLYLALCSRIEEHAIEIEILIHDSAIGSELCQHNKYIY